MSSLEGVSSLEDKKGDKKGKVEILASEPLINADNYDRL